MITEIEMIDQVFKRIEKTSENKRYILTVVMAYANSLLSFFIYPHKRLQLYLIDVCVECDNLVTLQQLLNFHVVLDSKELLDKLESTFPDPPKWLQQTIMDLGKRLSNTDVVVKELVNQKRFCEVVDYIRKYDPSYPIDKVMDMISDPGDRKILWKKVELWNISSGESLSRPVLSHRVIMLCSSG